MYRNDLKGKMQVSENRKEIPKNESKKQRACVSQNGLFQLFSEECSLESTEELKERIETIHQKDSLHSQSNREKIKEKELRVRTTRYEQIFT